jgi:hypothetical protein
MLLAFDNRGYHPEQGQKRAHLQTLPAVRVPFPEETAEMNGVMPRELTLTCPTCKWPDVYFRATNRSFGPGRYVGTNDLIVASCKNGHQFDVPKHEAPAANDTIKEAKLRLRRGRSAWCSRSRD